MFEREGGFSVRKKRQKTCDVGESRYVLRSGTQNPARWVKGRQDR